MSVASPFQTAFALLLAVALPMVSSRGEEAGKQIFASQCAACHGPRGAGTDAYNKALVGDLSPQQLAGIIQKTMPEDDPESLSKAQSLAVANFIHGEFYSPVAQARNNPPRIELARLTVQQYRRAVASLFAEPPQLGEQRGLNAQYFNHRRYEQQAVEKIDPQIDFDFGDQIPVPEIKDAGLYSIRWQGSLLVDDTGLYKIVLRSEQAVRLWLNDNDTPLLDGYVKSGDQNEYVADIFLVGGQAYPIKVEFARSNQGVTDEKQHEKHEKLESASVSLLWKPPGRMLRPIPQRHLSPDWSPEQFICTTPFPPDDRSYGWERGTSVSPSWDEATTSGAVEAAEYLRTHTGDLLRNVKGDNREAKLRKFCEDFVARAFRQPLTKDTRQQYVDSQFDAVEDTNIAARRVVLMTLKSPRFLYRELGSDDRTANTASRLAFTLTDAPPDQRLRDTTGRGDGRGELSDKLLRGEAERMIATRQGQSKLRQFLLSWLNVAGEVDLAKDSEQFPDFDEQAIDELRTSLELSVSDFIEQPDADYRGLFRSNEYYVSAKLVTLYGGQPVDAGYQRQPLGQQIPPGEEQRLGIITHPYVLARLAHADSTSPIHRGVFLVRSVLGQTLAPPPEAVAPLPAELHPDMTTRERVTMQTSERACMVCHNVINPLGFVLESFDAIGRLRDTDNGKPVDDSGFFQSREGETVQFKGPGELVRYLAESDQVSQAFVQQMFHFLVQQSIQAYGPNVRDELHQRFVESNYNIRQLAVEIAVVASRLGRDDDAESNADR